MSKLSDLLHKLPAFNDVVQRVKGNSNFQKSFEDLLGGVAKEGRKFAGNNALATLFFDQLEANKSKLVGIAAAGTPAEEHVDPVVVEQAKTEVEAVKT